MHPEKLLASCHYQQLVQQTARDGDETGSRAIPPIQQKDYVGFLPFLLSLFHPLFLLGHFLTDKDYSTLLFVWKPIS